MDCVCVVFGADENGSVCDDCAFRKFAAFGITTLRLNDDWNIVLAKSRVCFASGVVMRVAVSCGDDCNFRCDCCNE